MKKIQKKMKKVYFHFFFHSCNLTVPCFSSTLVSSLKFAPLLLFASGTSWKSLQFPTRASRLNKKSKKKAKNKKIKISKKKSKCKFFDDNKIIVVGCFQWI